MARSSLVALVLVIVPLALLAAGCGGSSSASPPATTTTAGATGAGGTQSAALAAFTTCLKQHGITTTGFGGFGRRPRGASGGFGGSGASGRFGPSGASGRFGPSGASGRRGAGFGRSLTAAQQKAFTACRSKLPAGTGNFRPGGAGGGTQNPAFAKYTQCLAKHGVKFGTASASGTAFAKASKACAKLRPAVGGAPSTTTTTG